MLAVEPVVKAENHESSIAVGTVVVFGTLAMLLYPLLYSHGLLPMSAEVYGAFAGATLHEVAHAVAAGQAISPEAGNTAVIVKMMRVIMLAPPAGRHRLLAAPAPPSATANRRKTAMPPI